MLHRCARVSTVSCTPISTTSNNVTTRKNASASALQQPSAVSLHLRPPGNACICASDAVARIQRPSMNVACRAGEGGESDETDPMADDSYFPDIRPAVDDHILSFFTFMAVQRILDQIMETDCTPGKMNYRWLYEFVLEHPPRKSKEFCMELLKQNTAYGQRVLVTRMLLLNSWLRTFSPLDMHTKMRMANLSHLREYLSSASALDAMDLAGGEDEIKGEDLEIEKTKTDEERKKN